MVSTRTRLKSVSWLVGGCLLLNVGCQKPQAGNPVAGNPPQPTVNEGKSEFGGLVYRRQLQKLVEHGLAVPDLGGETGEAVLAKTKGLVVFDAAPIVPNAAIDVSSDVAVFGSGIEAVLTAMAFSKTGKSVSLVYDAPLGGLVSDASANLRFFDGLPSIPRTPSQLELFKALGVKGGVSIPPGISKTIPEFLAEKYEDKIKLVKCQTLSRCKVTVGQGGTTVLLDSGATIRSRIILDMDPECRVGEAAGLEYDTKTLPLSYGFVFDVNGVRKSDIPTLQLHTKLEPQTLRQWAGVTESEAAADPKIVASEEKLRISIGKDFFFNSKTYSLGYKALAEGFHYAMLCRGLKAQDADAQWLNEHRVTSGFNLAQGENWINLNGISYQFPDFILQHDHKLTDAPWAPRVAIEKKNLEDYFQYILDRSDLTVTPPQEFYVRRATAHFPTMNAYSHADFEDGKRSRWWMNYGMDLRDVAPQDNVEKQLLADVIANKPTSHIWSCRPETCATNFTNFYILNRCSVPTEYFGGMRILQNLINTGQALVESLK